MKIRGNMGLLFIQMVVLVKEDTEKKETLNAFFASSFAKDGSQEFQNSGITEGQRKKDFPQVIEGWVRDQLGRLQRHKSIKPNGMHPRVLRELTDVDTLLFST